MDYKIIESTIQAGGKQRIQVAFMDDFKREHRRSYDFPAKADVVKEILIRQDHVEQGLKDQEIASVIEKIEKGETFELQYATATELKLRLIEIEIEKQTEIDKLLVEKENITAEVAEKEVK